MTAKAKALNSTYSESIYDASCMFIDEYTAEYEALLDRLIATKKFNGFADVMVHSDAEHCLIAACIAYRMKNDPVTAFGYFKTALRAMAALDKCVASRAALPADTVFEIEPHAFIPIGKFYLLAICLLCNGDRESLQRMRGYLDLPFVRMFANVQKEPDSDAAEIRILFAAWEGDLATVDLLTPPLEKAYKRYNIADIYTKLWRAVALRDSPMLDQLLPLAEEAYKKAARRREFDWYGGGKSYNQAMFDFYTTAVLKIAKGVGMHWTYGNDNTKQIWPNDVIDFWG